MGPAIQEKTSYCVLHELRIPKAMALITKMISLRAGNMRLCKLRAMRRVPIIRC